jgi:hypothetical protein
MSADVAYVCTADETSDDAQTVAEDSASLDLQNSEFLSLFIAFCQVAPKSGPYTMNEDTWSKTVPRRIADGRTDGQYETGTVIVSARNV